MLLDEIIKTATDDKHSLSVLLRKCLVLSYELKDDRLKVWANQELNGYESEKGLPEYRIVGAGAKGEFSGPGGSALHNYPIPSAALDEKHREFAEVIYLTQAISAYECVVANAKAGKGTFRIAWHENLALHYQRRFFEGRYVLISAWQDVAMSTLVELIETVRNRSLNMALELKGDLGATAENLQDMSSAEVEKVRATIINNISGGTNYFASGQSNLNATTNMIHAVITVGNRQELDSALSGAGLRDDDLKDLTNAIEKDGNERLGSKVITWAKANGSKIVTGGVKIGAKIGQELLVQWLKQYYGMA
jgi:hypothetical protein